MKRATLLVALMLTGCASGYQAFYHPIPGHEPSNTAATRVNPSPGVPLMDHIAVYTPQTVPMYEAQGYIPIGYSVFTASVQQDENGAMSQGKKVGADLVVVVSPEYVASKAVVAPIPSPGSNSAFSTGTAEVPVTINWFKYGALYFVKVKPITGTAFVEESRAEGYGR